MHRSNSVSSSVASTVAVTGSAYLVSASIGVAVLALAGTLSLFAARVIGNHRGAFISPDPLYVRMIFRYYMVMIGSGIAAFAMRPALLAMAQRLETRWRRAFTVAALAVICLAMSAFLVTAGRWQFGAFDYNILIDVGWRQSLGQRAYTDFITSTPPGFNLGMQLAFALFGPSWNANLYISALFSCATFLWIYWLMVLLGIGRMSSMLMSFAIQCAVMLNVCFWWYNNTTLMLATVFFLSCCLYAREPRGWRSQVSYVASLALLGLMKPNIAGVTAVGSIVLLLIITDRRARLVLLSLAACAAAVLILLANHISIPAMLASYHGASLERGGFTKFAYDQMNRFAQWTALAWVAIVSLPLFPLAPRAAGQVSRRDWRGLASSLLFFLTILVALYGVATNGDFRELDCAVLLGAGAVIAYGTDLTSPRLRRLYFAILVGGSLSDLYLGAMRARVYTVGPHQFFEWTDARHRVESGFLKDMRTTPALLDLEREIARAKDENAGPYYFGPRVDFNYAVLGVPSPKHLPLWWHPGTAFARRDLPQILQAWQQHRFQTLIFQRDDYTLYSQEFLDLIAKGYVRDDGYAGLTVYHARKND